MKTLSLALFGREVLSVTWDAFDPSTHAGSPAEEEEIGDGITYSCGHCAEVLVTGLTRPLTPRDEADLLSVHQCPARGRVER
ncbi:hypothetical protein [Nocardia sp. NPDC050435]|uniref:hypothetical protein n=1 Tax=Nocardia sp. NPDC050435 TaxID=3155040 RepID=UPI003404838B